VIALTGRIGAAFPSESRRASQNDPSAKTNDEAAPCGRRSGLVVETAAVRA
jgi:hypothetical protein